jgi:hypothetical protein
MTDYAELAVTTNFSFLRGASHPEEMVLQASYAGLAGIGIADRNSVAGVVRAHTALRETGADKVGFQLAVGARLVFADETPDILAYPESRLGWGRLCRLLTLGNLRARKGDCILHLDDLFDHLGELRRGASWLSSTFLVLLVVLLIANEIIHRRLFSLYLLIGLYFFAAFSYFIFLVPVLFRSIHAWTYVVSCLLSLAWIGGLLWILHRRGVFKRFRQLVGAGSVVVILFGTLNLFYVQNWMPPVPLSMRHAPILVPRVQPTGSPRP